MLRVDTHNVDGLAKGLGCYSFVYEDNEDGTNPHVHFYLETKLKNDSLRKRVKMLKDYRKGNGFYSLRELQPGDNEEFPYLKYHAYMAKIAQPEYVGFERARLSRLRDAVAEYNRNLKEELKARRLARKTIVQQISEYYEYDQNAPESTEQIAIDVINFYLEKGKLVRKFAMVSQVQTIALKYVPRYRSVLLYSIMRDVDQTTVREWLEEKNDEFFTKEV